jgi:hypothetical protein
VLSNIPKSDLLMVVDSGITEDVLFSDGCAYRFPRVNLLQGAHRASQLPVGVWKLGSDRMTIKEWAQVSCSCRTLSQLQPTNICARPVHPAEEFDFLGSILATIYSLAADVVMRCKSARKT